jgi:hypothetical protein
LGIGFINWGSGFGVCGSGFRVQGSGVRAYGLGQTAQGRGLWLHLLLGTVPKYHAVRRRVQPQGVVMLPVYLGDARFKNWVSGFMVHGSRFRIQGSRFRIQG